MAIEEENAPVFDLDRSHPARKFLKAFIDCQSDCAGCELGDRGDPIDQEWMSSTDGRRWTFSGFVYAVICFDIVLGGFLENAAYLTESEVCAADQLPTLRLMMQECAAAARQNSNQQIVGMIHQVQEMLNLWDAYLDFRKDMVTKAGNR